MILPEGLAIEHPAVYHTSWIRSVIVNSVSSKEPRFQFGENWTRFLSTLDDSRVEQAVLSIQRLLGIQRLDGNTFLDIGSGSGLFSLAARKLGATVHSFDFDTKSVACTEELKRRYFPGDNNWHVEQGSALDHAYMVGLGRFDYVYSWGVLHHTGDMWSALANAGDRVTTSGTLVVSIYNDQGYISKRWEKVKRAYVRSNQIVRGGLLATCLVVLWWRQFAHDLLRGELGSTWRAYGRTRGMSAWHDLVDWVGGYPFEVAKPEEIFSFYQDRGFTLQHLATCGGGKGCNEFVFKRKALG